jgi:hypothetical protein
MATFRPCNTTDDAEALAHLFYDQVYTRYGLPDTIVSDRGSLFTSQFWRTLHELNGTRLKHTTAYHPQGDGQTEVVNQWLEQYLRIFSNYEQDDWVDLLPHAELCYNSTEHTTIGVSPLVAYCGFQPRRTFLEPPATKNLGVTGGAASAAIDWSTRMTEITHRVQDAMRKAQEGHKRFYDRSHQPATFQVGDQVLLRSKNIKTWRASKKLDYRYLGPYTITEKINDNAFRLQLPRSLRTNDVFSVQLLKTVNNDTVADRPAGVTRPIHSAEDTEYEVEAILGERERRSRGRRVQEYLVKWAGYPSEYNTWEPRNNLEEVAIFGDYLARREPTATRASRPRRR